MLTKRNSRGHGTLRFWLLNACAAGAYASAAFSQTPAPPAFEVATVKISPPLDFGAMMAGKARIGVKMDAGRIDIGSTSLRDVILAAYRLKEFQLSGPDWMKTVSVDILAKLPAGASESQVPEMLQTLLAERFGLKIHREARDHPVYALVVGKAGLKLKEAVPDPENPPVAADPKAPDFGMMSRMANSKMSGDPAKGMVISGLPQGGTMRMSFTGAGMHIESSSLTMSALAEDLTQYLDRPVVDKTGLKGSYQVGLDVSMEDMRNFMSKQSFPGGGGPPPGGGDFGGAGNPFAAGGSETSGSSILESVQRLGLKLETQKATMDAIVVDHLEKTPLEN
jgi:uncharacterized protein (TIGR03435 family)